MADLGDIKTQKTGKRKKTKTLDEGATVDDNVTNQNPKKKRRSRRVPESNVEENGNDNPSFNHNDSNNTPVPAENEITSGASSSKLPGKKRRNRPGNAAQTGGTTMEGQQMTQRAPKKKKTTKKRQKKLETGAIESLGIDMADIQDDIVDDETDVDFEQEATAQQNMMRSQPVDRLYIEKSNGFKSANRTAVENSYLENKSKTESNERDDAIYPVKPSSMLFALKTVAIYRSLARFLMGVLAGLSIWQTLFIFTLTNPEEFSVYLQLYRGISIPINSVFYISLVLITVAVFDRYDIAKTDRKFLIRACTLQSGAVSCLLLTIALAVNVSMASWDDKLSVYVNGTTDSLRQFTNQQEADTHVMTWRILTIIRTCLICIAWFIVSLQPTTDRLTENLAHTELAWAKDDATEKKNIAKV